MYIQVQIKKLIVKILNKFFFNSFYAKPLNLLNKKILES